MYRILQHVHEKMARVYWRSIQNTGQTSVKFLQLNLYIVYKNSWKFIIKIVFYYVFSIAR